MEILPHSVCTATAATGLRMEFYSDALSTALVQSSHLAQTLRLFMSSDEVKHICYRQLSAMDLMGLLVQTEAAFLGLAADAYVLGIIIWKLVNNKFIHRARGWKLIEKPLDIFIIALIMVDTLQGLGTATNLRWLILQATRCSRYCTFQGIIQILGESGSAIMTLIITIFTFLKIGFGLPLRRHWPAYVVVLLVFAYLGIFSEISAATRENADIGLITPAPFWCWIRSKYTAERIVGGYLWLWLAALSSISPSPLILYRQWQRGGQRAGEDVHWRILLFPISYTILVLPLSVTRWVGWRIEKRTGSDRLPPAAYLAACALFQLTPFANIVLIFMRGGIKLVKFEKLERVPSPRSGASVDRLDIRNQPTVRMSFDTRSSDIVEEVTVLDQRLEKEVWK